jgi:very-short-patch-repair endonuclease
MENANEKISMHQGAKPRIFDNARKNRERNTEAEKVLWEALRLKRLDGYKFRNQHPISDYIVDFYCHTARLAIEVDGEYHAIEDQKDYDLRRTEALKNSGIMVLRFSNEEVLKDLESVLTSIRSQLAEQTSNQ